MMADKKKIVALIPLKGKSKSIPRKNIKLIGGKPLCYWVLSAAARSKHIQDIYVSTEDDEIKDIVSSFNFGVKFIPETLTEEKDISVIERVMLNFLDHVNDFDVLVTFQATAPLTTESDVDKAIEQFFSKNHDSMLTGVPLKRFFWTKDGKALNYDYTKRPLRQIFEGTIMENGAFYITKKEVLRENKNRLGGNIGVYEMPEYTATELDEHKDWEIVENIFKERNGTSL